MNTDTISVKNLNLDITNYRTTTQQNEEQAIHALIAIDTEWFWALMESLLDDGYLPTENIIILQNRSKYIVKEGNRRVASLKLIHGFVKIDKFPIPQNIKDRILNLPDAWRKDNLKIPCTIYGSTESLTVDKIVALTHGKGELAGRAKWKAIARARHNRDKNNTNEPGLDLLEKFFIYGNGTEKQNTRWAGDYPLSVLDEAIRKLSPQIGYKSARDLSDAYPETKYKKHKSAIDRLIVDIGLEELDFKEVRNPQVNFAEKYGAPPETNNTTDPKINQNLSPQHAPQSPKHDESKPLTKGSTPSTNNLKPKALSFEDPKHVLRSIKGFVPRGKGREKLVTMLEEMKHLKLDKHPHAFCFLLRSLFEISAKAYCKDHANSGGPSATTVKGDDKKLVEVLREITNHITKNKTDRAKLKQLHGAITEIAKPEGILSVTSMNQLVHNPRFSIQVKDICILFGNVFPLLEEMNS